MANTCGWDSLPFKLQIDFLKPCWMCAPPQNVVPSILLAFVWKPFLLIVYKFVLSCAAFNCIYEIF